MTRPFGNVRFSLGDCRDLLAGLPDASVDAVVTDPPYELGFMGKGWDASGIAYSVDMWAQVLRVLKPGGHLLAFGGTRTYHRMACAVEDAGFEIRDSIHWIYGSGFPKSLDVSKAIDKAAGATREVIGRTATPFKVDAAAHRGSSLQGSVNGDFSKQVDANGYRYTEHTAPATPDAARWSGWGTAIKPSHEPIIVARKPLAGTVAANVLAHGTGAINVDATRVQPDGELWTPSGSPGPARDSVPCTCAERPACSTDGTSPDRGSSGSPHNSRTDDPGSAEPQPAPSSDPPASGRSGATGHQQPLGSQADCRPSLRSDGAPALSGEVGDLVLAQRARDGGTSPDLRATPGHNLADPSMSCPHHTARHVERQGQGRWPANIVLTHDPDCAEACADGCPVAEMDGQSGTTSSKASAGRNGKDTAEATWGLARTEDTVRGHTDSGGASRFFPVFRYCAKAPTKERPVGADGTKHPTVKPLDLMRWLVRLVTPPGGTVLEPFAGSGTTVEACVLEGFDVIAFERDASYAGLIADRIIRARAA